MQLTVLSQESFDSLNCQPGLNSDYTSSCPGYHDIYQSNERFPNTNASAIHCNLSWAHFPVLLRTTRASRVSSLPGSPYIISMIQKILLGDVVLD